VTSYDGLAALVDEIANRVDRWTEHASWVESSGSQAAAEFANGEMRQDGSPWGDRPIRTVYAYSQMEIKLTVELSRCAALLIGASRPAPGIETVARAALEAGSVAWWLLEDGLTARERVCRMQLLRRNSARELARSIEEVGEDPLAVGSETVADIDADCQALGLAAFTRNGSELEGQTRLGYTARVRALTDELGYQGAYSLYSGVAHAELAGVWRLFTQTGATWPGREPLHAPAPSPQASFAAASGVLKSMMGPVERIALLFGWKAPGLAEEVGQTIDYINSELKRLEPRS
jgi:hypothetical protein